ncbi:MAG: hypothetical protein GX495_15905 [Chloroflexi bacterium]|nr:hypothetical protein [Chloroflexota bacterium]
MMRNRPLVVLIFLLILASLACRALLPDATPTTSPALQTEVRGTLTAAAPETGITATVPPESEAPATPAPDAQELHIAYIKNGEVWLWTQSEGSRQISTQGEITALTISGDGQVIAFLRQADEVHVEMWAVNRDGSNERLLESVEALSDMDPGAFAVVPHQMEFFPGTHRLAYNTRQVLQGPGMLLYNDLRVVDTDTLEHGTLLAPGEGGQFHFSPDGSQIAVVTPTEISLVNVDGSNRRDALLNYERVLTYSEYEYYARPVWAPDSSKLRVAIPPHDSLDPAAPPTTLWEIPTSGSPAVQIGQITAAPFFGSEAMYAPDLEHLLYLKQVGDPAANMYELHLSAADASEDVIVHTASPMTLEGWAPDSTHFVFYQGGTRTPTLGAIDGSLAPLIPDAVSVLEIYWVDAERFIYLDGGLTEEVWSLRLNTVGGESMLIDELSGPIPVVDFTGG